MAGSISELRHALKNASTGNGKVRELITGCGFDIGLSGFTTLIATCGKRGHFDKAMEIFQTMLDRGVRPNAITYTSLISVLSSAGKCEDVLEVFLSMKADSREHADCLPDHIVYRSLIPAFSKAGLYEKVFDLYQEMEESCFQPNRSIQVALVSSYLSCGKLDEACRVLNEMHAEGVAATRREYPRVITASCDAGDWDYAVETFLTMQGFGVDINSDVCDALLKGSFSCGKPHMGLELLIEMETSRMQVSLEMYNEVLQALSDRGMWEESLRLFRRMEKRGVQVNKDTAVAVVASCLNAGKRDMASSLAAHFRVAMNIDVCATRASKTYSRSDSFASDETSQLSNDCTSAGSSTVCLDSDFSIE